MARRRRRRSKSLAVQSVELGFAVPQVIAHRLARIASAGASPSARDRAEFQRMGTEKIAALNEAWAAMAAETFRAQQEIALSLWFPWINPGSAFNKASRQISRAGLDILGAGMAPARRRAVANAKRFGRTKRRR